MVEELNSTTMPVVARPLHTCYAPEPSKLVCNVVLLHQWPHTSGAERVMVTVLPLLEVASELLAEATSAPA